MDQGEPKELLQKVVVIDFDMTFDALTWLFVKAFFAAILAAICVSPIIFIVLALLAKFSIKW